MVALSADTGLFCGDFFGLSMLVLGWEHLIGDPWATGVAGDTSL